MSGQPFLVLLVRGQKIRCSLFGKGLAILGQMEHVLIFSFCVFIFQKFNQKNWMDMSPKRTILLIFIIEKK